MANGGPIAEDNIINRRGGESIYQSCVNLKKRLAELPPFLPHIEEMDASDRSSNNTDPVASLWNCLRNGYPLLTIYNASDPEEFLQVDPAKVLEAKRPKAATFKFLQASLQELAFPQQDCFLITDLYGDSTTGFTKVIKMVNKVLDILEMQGQLKKLSDITSLAPVAAPCGKLTRRQHILKELLETERDYVHHLQNLQALKKELEETGALTGDASHQIFLNLNNLLDFAQRFLIRIEQHYALNEEDQNWGALFIQHEDAFRQYEPFISNQIRCDAVCLREWDKIRMAPRSLDLQQMVAQPATLNGFFVKPFQRLTKYPLMLSELRKQAEDPEIQHDISRAIDAIQNVLDSANDAIDKEHLAAAFMDLDERVDDWKSLKIETFGDLLRFGTFTVIKGDNGKDSEREVRTLSITHIYEDFWPATFVYPAQYGLRLALDIANPEFPRNGLFKIQNNWKKDARSNDQPHTLSSPLFPLHVTSRLHGPIALKTRESTESFINNLGLIIPPPHGPSSYQSPAICSRKESPTSPTRPPRPTANAVSWRSA
ncbi:hypothetical protein FE257_009390 [Aspergillus nanangensis]|uniref:DH domain-containing protein n=1 Tax=Aspergillus nanangensis TaxID=2582783 RepID=A0AAD4CK49_ASPNN|nr:hypothetical protein FE257_009390 [Aspergillus nanangensis]